MSVIWRVAPPILIVLLTLAAVIKLRPLLLDFDTVLVRFDFVEREESAGKRFDRVLLKHLDSLSYIRSFDRVLRSGSNAHTIAAPLWMDRCEVRQGDFYKFVGWQVFHQEHAVVAPGTPPDWRPFSSSRTHRISGRLDAPANGVTWYDAYAYCRSAGGRLPDRREWTSAASGVEGRLYPWGDTFDPAPWPYLDPLLNAAQQCAVYPDTDTPSGIADLGQHVSEWATDNEGALSHAPIMGGNAYNVPQALYGLVALYRRAPRDYRSAYLGFRCVYETKPSLTPWNIPPNVVRIAPGTYSVGIPEKSIIAGLITHLAGGGQLDLIAEMFDRGHAEARDLYVTLGEVTRRQYAVFLGDPFVRAGLYAEDNQPADHDYKPPDWDAQMAAPDLPVVNIDWWSAYAFASWAGGRLPTAEEWAFVASGGEQIYPWGDSFRATAAVNGERRNRAPVPVDIESGDGGGDDITADGVINLAGNVSEWTRSASSFDGAYTMIVKGGNYLLPGEKTARMDFSNHVSPNYRSKTLGFRIVFDRPR